MNFFINSTDSQEVSGTLNQHNFVFDEGIELSESNLLSFTFFEGKETIGTAFIYAILDDEEYREEIEESLRKRKVIGRFSDTMLYVAGMYIKPEYRGHKLQNIIKLTKEILGYENITVVIGPVCCFNETLTKEEMLRVPGYVLRSKNKANESFLNYLKSMV